MTRFVLAILLIFPSQKESFCFFNLSIKIVFTVFAYLCYTVTYALFPLFLQFVKSARCIVV